MTDATHPVTQSVLEAFAREYLDNLGATIREDGSRWRVRLPSHVDVGFTDSHEFDMALDSEQEGSEEPVHLLTPESGFTQQLLDEAENPFNVDERLEELDSELQSEYPDHDLTQQVVDAVEGTSIPSEERVGKLIEEAGQLLDGVDEQLLRIRESINELPDGSVMMIDPLD